MTESATTDKPPCLAYSPEVLVVEDEEPIRLLLETVLRQYSFTVRLAASGAEAVELYKRHHDTITLILLDVQMDGLDGPGTLAAIHRLRPQVRCCFMSGHTGKYTTEQLLRMGADHVLAKPFSSLAELARLISEIAASECSGGLHA